LGFKLDGMFAKIFSTIFDSSIAEDYKVRHVFEDFLKLADVDGCVNMTVEAVARRTNVPLEEVRYAIGRLMEPDSRSQSKEQGGRRLMPVDPGRDWGWVIVNYHHYRDLMSAEELRESWRTAKAAQRARQRTKLGKVGRKRNQGLTEGQEKILNGKLEARAAELAAEHHPDGVGQL
jgi:hypothetical protein